MPLKYRKIIFKKEKIQKIPYKSEDVFPAYQKGDNTNPISYRLAQATLSE